MYFQHRLLASDQMMKIIDWINQSIDTSRWCAKVAKGMLKTRNGMREMWQNGRNNDMCLSSEVTFFGKLKWLKTKSYRKNQQWSSTIIKHRAWFSFLQNKRSPFGDVWIIWNASSHKNSLSETNKPIKVLQHWHIEWNDDKMAVNYQRKKHVANNKVKEFSCDFV